MLSRLFIVSEVVSGDGVVNILFSHDVDVGWRHVKLVETGLIDEPRFLCTGWQWMERCEKIDVVLKTLDDVVFLGF